MPLRDIATGSKTELELLLGMLDATTEFWRQELRGLKAEELRFQARPGGHSIAMLILHIADAELWWIQAVALGNKLDKAEEKRLMTHEVKQDDGIWPVPPKRTKKWLLAQHDSIRERTKSMLQGLDPTAPIKRKGWRNEYTLRWILHHLVEHEAYHGGQMLLLRDLYQAQKR